uniref:RNA-directed DNA polymerase, eukaryota, reverse transcriptase zinc-binding domain protein n=1 Tax=Tanacetum cinerariifolium TaxID=118510 RepID=A0A6L2JFX6_TANCI|nr:RNA-directed DNA polymerase, eukaryota, reverse transcriptase zinc-binding domain protein [Tanacetum cinerariifolium]
MVDWCDLSFLYASYHEFDILNHLQNQFRAKGLRMIWVLFRNIFNAWLTICCERCDGAEVAHGDPQGSLGDKIIRDLDKTPDLSQRSPQNYPKCGNPVDGHYCQGCALLQKKFKEDLFAYCIENEVLQDSFEPSYDNTNVVNALREPFVVNQDPGKNSSQSPPQINHHCCYECDDLLEDIFCHQCTCELYERGAHYGYNCPPKVPVVSNSEPFSDQTVNEPPQTLPIFDTTCYSEDGNSFTYDSTPNLVHDSPNVFNPPLQPPIDSYEFCGNDAYYGQDCSLQVPCTYDSEPCYNQDFNFSQNFQTFQQYPFTPSLSTEEPDNSLSMGDEHLDTILATESDEFIKSIVESLIPIPSEFEGIPDNMCDVPFHDNSPPLVVSKDQFEDFFNSNDGSTSIDNDSFSIDNIEYVEASPPDSEPVSSEVMEIVIPEVGGIDDDILLTIKDDILREKLLNINLLIANIEALNDNPTPSSDFMTKSLSTSLNSLLEETNTFDNSLPEFETLCFDLEEISSGSTTTRSDISLSEYEVFYDDHVKEISSGSTTTHSNSSLYDSFIFDLSINPFPPADRSDFYEFVDELTHIISPPEYDFFCFKIEPNLGDFTMDVVEDISPTRELRVHIHNVLPTHPTLQLNMEFILSSEPLFAYVYSQNLKTRAEGFRPQVFISSASLGNHVTHKSDFCQQWHQHTIRNMEQGSRKLQHERIPSNAKASYHCCRFNLGNREIQSYKEFIDPVATLETQRQRYPTEEQEQSRNRCSLESVLNVNPQHYQQKQQLSISMQASNGNLENDVPATSTYQRNLSNHTVEPTVHNLSANMGAGRAVDVLTRLDVVGKLGTVNNSFADILKSNNSSPNSLIVSSLTIVLDDSCIARRDFSSSLMGKIKDINVMSNLYRILSNEGFKNVKLSYLGGIIVWISVEGLLIRAHTRNTFTKVVSQWGECIDVEDNENLSLPFKRLCLKTKPYVIINDKIKIIMKGQIYWIQIKELDAWSPNFDFDQEDNSSSDEESEHDFVRNKSDNFELDNDEEIDHVSESSCMHDKAKPSNSNALAVDEKVMEINSERISHQNIILADNNETASSDKIGNASTTKFKASSSILDVMDELIKALWSNFCFDYVLCPSIGYSGGSLCVWDPRIFVKDNSTISDLFLAISGTWVPTSTKLLIISVYAPQELLERKMLWDYIHHSIDSWDGECVILEDFNEVRHEEERYGTVFNVHGANAFNNFITTSGLVDLPLGGYSFTWSRKSASKMSKLDRFLISEGLFSLFPSIPALCLDRHLSDHRPIIMRELNTDYGPTPFHFFTLGLIRKGLIIWWRVLGRRQLSRLSNLDKTIDKGRGTNDTVNDRSKLLEELHDLNSFTSLDLAQKAKIRERVVEPAVVKKEFFNHFSNRFAAPISPKISIQLQFPKRLSLDQNEILERTATYDEIKKAVWDCGTNKSSGPDGFSFKFFKRYWGIIDRYVVAAVLLFFSTGSFPPGCNSSFIVLIPKTQEAKLVKDFRPISLIGSMYKSIAKILANRLSLVIPDLVSDVQSDFISSRQILDGPFILNELFSWCKRKNTKAMIFKVDFKKAFDSVRWDFLDEVLHKFGFGDKWRGWIQGCLSSAMGSILVNGSPTSEFQFYKGLKQGDPLSPFLFILIMESLHVSFENVLTAGLFKGIRLDDSLSHSHLFYAYDVVFVGERKMSLIGWKYILASKKNGGLGISSLFALNRTPFFKWIWRFITNGFSLWSRVINVFYGNRGAIDIIHNSSRRSPWLDIIYKTCSVAVKVRDTSFIASFRRPPRGGIEVDQLRLLGNFISPIVLSNSNDRWLWRLDSAGVNSMKSACCYIDDSFLPKVEVSTRWIVSIPINVNTFAWKVCLDKLPTRLNLCIRGLDIPSILCPNCYIDVESTMHIFFSCDLAHQLMRKVTRWWEVKFHNFHSHGDWLLWFKNLRFFKVLKDVFEGVCYMKWWVIWKYRNQVLFGNIIPRMDLLFDEIYRLSYSWVSSRCKSLSVDWNVWIKNLVSLSL